MTPDAQVWHPILHSTSLAGCTLHAPPRWLKARTLGSIEVERLFAEGDLITATGFVDAEGRVDFKIFAPLQG